jgi:hypothetical protein
VASMPDKSMKYTNKALIKIYKDIFINHQIKNLLKVNIRSKILVVCAFESKRIIGHVIKNKRVTYINHEYNEYSNIGESIKEAIKTIPDDQDITIINLSMVIDPKIMKQIKPKNSSIIKSDSTKFKSKIGCTHDPNNNVEFIFYDLEHKICEYLYIHKKDTKIFKNIVQNHIKDNMYLFEIINTMIHHKMKISMETIKSNIINFTNIDQLPYIKTLFKKINNATTV